MSEEVVSQGLTRPGGRKTQCRRSQPFRGLDYANMEVQTLRTKGIAAVVAATIFRLRFGVCLPWLLARSLGASSIVGGRCAAVGLTGLIHDSAEGW